MKTNILLFIIDMQYDFCSPDGALYVKGAEDDCRRLADFISVNERALSHIIFTQDSHNVIDISHPAFWEDRDGNLPSPFTTITWKEATEGKWKPRFYKSKAVEYLKKLEDQGEYMHVVWPEHCIKGSRGAALMEKVLEPVKKWARKGNFYDLVIKGTHPLTEHFGALKASVPVRGAPETQLNTELVDKLTAFDRIYIAGEAKSHCVATTIKQMIGMCDLGKKLFILEDCMSDVTGFETVALSIYQKALEDGAVLVRSTEKVS